MHSFSSFIELQEFRGWIHDSAPIHKFGEDMAKERKRITGQDYHSYNKSDPLDSESTKHMHKILSDAHKKGKTLSDAELTHHARVGWAKGVMKLNKESQAKTKKFSNGYELSRHDNAKMALDSYNKGRDSVSDLKHHLIKNGVPEKEAHNYTHDYDGTYGRAAKNVFNHNRGKK